jgi:hypothetical protein
VSKLRSIGRRDQRDRRQKLLEMSGRGYKAEVVTIPDNEEVLQCRLRVWYPFEDAGKRVRKKEGGNELH